MRWFEKKPDPTVELMKIIIENQERTQAQFMLAVNSMAQASTKQAEILGEYLKMFQTPGEPIKWEYDLEESNIKEMTDKGYPREGTEQEQIQWLFDHTGELDHQE